ncbi:DUF7384 family protein [Natronomonas sp. EA1]|uniref:DUF7384 family protein n=1 Tax=Natronomonas sp. EA1 TaxID=3421655 RepID=UPI003EB75856
MTDLSKVVADADVLAADLLIGGPARDALDLVRSHSWLQLVASDELLDDAQAVIADLADPGLAADWREAIEDLRTPVEQPPGDHPGLASALHGDAVQLLSFDDRLTSAKGGVTIRKYVEVSVKHPDAYVQLFDPERMYPEIVGGEYPGPDRDPRA